MPRTVWDLLCQALEDLNEDQYKRFTNKLVDLREEPRVRRSAVEGKDRGDLANILIDKFTEQRAVTITVDVLKKIDCNQTAKELEQEAADLAAVSQTPITQPAQITQSTQPTQSTTAPQEPQPQTRDLPVPTPQVSAGASGPQADGNDEPDTSSALVPCTLQFKEVIMREKGKEVYPVLEKHVRKRLALLINNVEFDYPGMRRNGAERDEKNMEKLLRGLGYDVVKYNNLSRQEMDDAIKSFAAREEHKHSDSTFVVIMSHGKRDAILGVHYGPKNKDDFLPVDNIFTHLNTANCDALFNKPKVILIQACRGGESGGVWHADSEPKAELNMESDAWEHKEMDFIPLMSCTPDTKSYRHPKNGTLFVKFLIQVFNENAHKDHVEELFRQVMKKFDEFKSVRQMVCKDRVTLKNLFYLFPGL